VIYRSPLLSPLLSQLLSLLGLLLVMQSTHAQIIDLRSGQEISEQMLVDRLRTQDIVLLGELHDNAKHHALRAQLIKQIARDKLTVIAEHLPSGARVKREGGLLTDLEAAGFDAKAWQWPLHSPLFDAVRGAKLQLIGGNLPKGFSKQLFAQGESALPSPMAQAYKTASLSADASRRLDQDLIDGHCGKLPEKYLQLSALVPALKQTAVGFYEADSPREELVKSLAGRYDIVWLSEPAERSDPCENFKIK